VVDHSGGHGYPAPLPRSPGPVVPDPRAFDIPMRDSHAPRHLAERWEGPVKSDRAMPSRRHGWHWLLLIPMVMPLLVPLYNRAEPRLLGLPFFYWYQLACVVISIGTVTAVYQLTKGRRPRWPR
jgi:hypothetical protein